MSTRPSWLEDLLEHHVHARIANDPRTRKQPNTFLGWPKNEIFWDVLGGGQADFTSAIKGLAASDRALLYARYNQGRHLDELDDAFRQLFADSSRAGRPTVIDLGCGPFTAGLALAAAIGVRPFRYVGIDRAPAMCELGDQFARAAWEAGAFHPGTTWCFADDLDGHDFGPVRGDITLVVASYLLASPTLKVSELVPAVVRALARIGPGPAAVLYTNTGRPEANIKFPVFRDALVAEGFEVRIDDVERFTRTKTPADLRYALLYRGARTTLEIDEAPP